MADAGEHAPLILRRTARISSNHGSPSRARIVLGVVLAALLVALVASTTPASLLTDALSKLRVDLFGAGVPPTVRVLVNPRDWPERDTLDVVSDTWRRYHEESGAVVVPLELPDPDRWPMGGGYAELTAKTSDLLPGTRLDFLAFEGPDRPDLPLVVARGRQRVAASSLGHLGAWLDARREDGVPALAVVDADDPGDPKLPPIAMAPAVARELTRGGSPGMESRHPGMESRHPGWDGDDRGWEKGWDVLFLDRGTARFRWKFYVVSARFLARLPLLLRDNPYVATTEWTKGLCRAGTLRCFDYFGEIGGAYEIGDSPGGTPPPPPPPTGENRENGRTVPRRSRRKEKTGSIANTGSHVLGSGGDWRDVDKAVASVGALDRGGSKGARKGSSKGARKGSKVSNASSDVVRFSSNDKSYRKAEKVEKAVAYHVQDVPRNSSNPEDMAMTLARGLSPALDELSEDASKTADDVVDFILNGRLPEEDDWPAKNRARVEEELREQEDAREREIREQEAAMERRAMEDLWSDGPAMEEAMEREREREEDEKEVEAREEKAEASSWLADVLG